MKYKEIEGMDWEGDTVSIHTLKGQKWLKDFLWRTTEEITESYESYENSHLDHTIEELADALHFFIEFCILAGIPPNKLEKIEFIEKTPEFDRHMTIEDVYWLATYHLGLIGNTFKNKPWKKHQMKTDANKFLQLVQSAFVSLISCFFIHGEDITAQTIYDYYFRKSKVNEFRQRSNY